VRALFDPWAEGLSEDDFAGALAAIGVTVAADLEDAGRPLGDWHIHVGDILAGADERAGLVAWRSPLADPRWEELAGDAEDWSNAWPDGRVSVRLSIHRVIGDLDPNWLVDELGRLPIDSVFIDRDAGPGVIAPWRFPLRVGVLDDEAGRQLHQELRYILERGGWPQRLIEPVLIGAEGVACDLLVTEGPIDAISDVRQLRVGAIAALDRSTLHPSELEAVADRFEAQAWGIVERDDPVGWCLDMVEQIAHDETFDMAFHRTGGRLLEARTSFVEAHTARRRAAAVVDALETVARDRPVTRRAPAELDIVRDIQHIALGHFDHESDEASRLAEAESVAAERLDQDPRWLQAQIIDLRQPNVPLGQSFIADVEHRIDVRIGPRDIDWVTSSTPFPEDELVIEAPIDLTVVLTEPNLLASPQIGTITLPAVGVSTTVSFSLRTTPDTERVEAVLTVVSGNRVLHTATLAGEVTREGRAGSAISLRASQAAELETVVRSSLQGLADRRRFDAALLLNSGSDGAARGLVVADDQAVTVPLDAVDVVNAVTKISRRLGEIVDSPEDFSSLDAPGTRELLVFLATHGSMMRDSLVTHSLGSAIADATHLQVVASKPDAYFPLEFAYDFPAPDPDATVCAEVIHHLSDSRVEHTCPGPHDQTIVCPFGFWAISKVIERHAYKQGSDLASGFHVRAQTTRDRRRIRLDGGALFAASDRVDNFAEDAIAGVATAIATATGNRAATVSSWEEWKAEVASRGPAVLLLMPHLVHSDVIDAHGLEIGSSATTWVSQISNSLLPPGEKPVIVALLGCETAAAGTVSYERIPGRFQLAGAEVVIGTLTEVLGRHAAPVGSRLVELLYESCREGPRMVGEVMLALRRQFLADGMPMVLSLAAFGDADWILEAAV